MVFSTVGLTFHLKRQLKAAAIVCKFCESLENPDQKLKKRFLVYSVKVSVTWLLALRGNVVNHNEKFHLNYSCIFIYRLTIIILIF